MLPIKTIPESDLIACLSYGKPMSTRHIHPIYLPPVLCWLNEVYIETQRLKAALSTLLKVISNVFIVSLMVLHMRLLLQPKLLGFVGTAWCSSVMFGLSFGIIGAAHSSNQRDEQGAIELVTGTRISARVRMCVLMYTIIVFMITYVYSDLCTDTARTSPGCGQQPYPRNTVWWTNVAGLWIAIVGVLRLCYV